MTAKPHDTLPSDQRARLANKRLLMLPQTHYGLAEGVIMRHGDGLLHVPGLGWHVWDGTRWRRDDDGAVVRCVKSTVRELREAAARMPPGDGRDGLWKFANRAEQ